MSETTTFVRDWKEPGADPAFIGKSIYRVDAPEKVTGQAAYTLDLTLPKMAYGKLKLSTVPHATLKNIDASRAKALPGVLDVLTPEDIPDYVKWGVHPMCYDQTPLARGRVRFIGDAVAAVVARDANTAAEAVELIDVDYEPLPAVFDPMEALEEGAPQIHEDKTGTRFPSSFLSLRATTVLATKPIARPGCVLDLDPLNRGRSILDVHLD